MLVSQSQQTSLPHIDDYRHVLLILYIVNDLFATECCVASYKAEEVVDG
jgi:hypothetical protein